MWLGGFVMAIVALAADGGTLGGDSDMVDTFILGLGLMAIGATATAGSIATSVLTTRAPGMTMRRVPFFTWSALVTSLGIVVVMPVFVGTLTYLFLDHRNGRTGFGGNSGIATWAGWMFTQPASYLFAIPAIGLFAETLPITFRKRTPARGVMYAGLSLVGVAAFAAVTQQQIQNLPWSGSELNLDDLGDKFNDLVPYTMFNLVPLLGLAIVLLMGLVLAKPQKGAGAPNLQGSVGVGLFGYGMILVGMTGTVLYSIDDLALQGTVFEEAVLVYVVYGAVLGAMGAVALWAPKLWGHTIGTAKLLGVAVLGVAATVLAAFPHYIAGFLDQPGGVLYEDSDLAVWNVLSLVGHGLMALTILAFLGLVAAAARGGGQESGQESGDDPFHGQTIEWSTTSPAPADNYVDVPMIHSAEPMLDLADGDTV
jgi:cytochrome o ubiquinol oxidase subunit 1